MCFYDLAPRAVESEQGPKDGSSDVALIVNTDSDSPSFSSIDTFLQLLSLEFNSVRFMWFLFY